MNKNDARVHFMEAAFSAHPADLDLGEQYLMILTWARKNPGKSPEIEKSLQTIQEIIKQNDGSRLEDLKMLTEACSDIIIMLESENQIKPAAHLVQ